MRKGTILALAVLAVIILAYGEAALAKEKNEKTVTVANLNIFHGIPCALVEQQHGEQITQCHLTERIALLFENLVAIGCPDIVTLQEMVTKEYALVADMGACVGPLDDTVEIIEEWLPSLNEACGFTHGYGYEVVFDPAARRNPFDIPCLPGRGIDEELILTRYKVLSWEVRALYGPVAPFFFRHMLYAQIDHPVGLLAVFTTHLASESDFASSPCGINVLPFPFMSPLCPDECEAFVDTVQECQAKQVTTFVVERHTGPEPAVITGDFNARPRSATYTELAKTDPMRKQHWIDSYLVAGNPECNPRRGIGCTAGRDGVGGDLANPALNVDERIDYTFVVPSAPELGCKIQKGTGLFADEPNVPCGPSGPICWASDHNGTRVNLSCKRSADRALGLASW